MRVVILCALGALLLGGTDPASAQGARAKREPTAGQMAARERQKKCGMEWREAKKANQTGGVKWPQYWSKCNARLKGNQA